MFAPIKHVVSNSKSRRAFTSSFQNLRADRRGRPHGTRGSAHPSCAAVFLVLVNAWPSPSRATTYQVNVSDIVTGQTQSFQWPVNPPVKITNDRTIEFEGGVSASIDNEATAYYAGQWPERYGVPTQAIVNRFQLSPAPTTAAVYATPFYRHADGAFVDAPIHAKGKKLGGGLQLHAESLTALQGRASTTLNYRVKVTIKGTQGAPAGPYFVEFAIPTRTRGIETAYDLIPGDNGGTYVYSAPNSAQSRSSVAVYIDNLPAFLSESIYRYPNAAAQYPHPNAFDAVSATWGEGVNGDRAVLFLGNLTGQQTFAINFVVQTETQVDSKKCGTQPGGFNAPAQKICQVASEKLALPLVPLSSAFDFQIYALPVLIIPPHPIPHPIPLQHPLPPSRRQP